MGGSLFKSALHITLCLFYMSILDFVSLLPVPVCVLVSCSLINLVNLSFRHREGGVREQVSLIAAEELTWWQPTDVEHCCTIVGT